ncbi:MAG TPA: 5-formyltetrahydrofolate cyclo-ligase [Segetibacter sp.]|jgi:5-formyltetrahydrofolate cyclo-ligase
MTKKELRHIYKEKRFALSENERSKLDDLLLIQFQRLSFEDVQIVLSFWPMDDRGEMNTHLFTRYLSHLIPGLQVCYPVTDPSSNTMKAVLVDDDTVLEENSYGITEPVNGIEVAPEDIDLVLVPLFAFDERGFRVGYGKGYYDRYLKDCNENVRIVGLSYFEAVDHVSDTNQFDVPLNYCITPGKVYEF